MADKSIIIIGAGIAGMTAGIYARLNGYDVKLFEMDIKPGGLCTAWERKGYVVDGCLHWLVGTSPGSNYYQMWKDTGVIGDNKIINMEQFYRFEQKDGKEVIFYTNVEKLEKHLFEIAPEDRPFISDITAAIRRFANFDPPCDKAPELFNPIDSMKMLAAMKPFMGEIRKWSKMSVGEMAERFNSPLLKQAVKTAFPSEMSSLFFIMTLAWSAAKNAGYVIGGSMKIALSMEKRFFELGGRIKYNSRVEKILTENGRATGVRLASGEEHKADYVISAADGYSTVFNMLDGKYIDEKIRECYRTMPIFKPLVYIGLGVYNSFSEYPHIISGISFPLDKPIKVDNTEHNYLNVRIHNFDPMLASEGKTLLTSSFESDFDYWNNLMKNPEDYKAEKERLAAAVVAALNRRFPGMAKDLEMWDVATPCTFYRYTGNWKGSMEGWMITPENAMLQMKKTLPGLDNFYMAGQWVSPGGGLPSGLITGHHAIQMICRKDKKEFITNSQHSNAE
jgi:phytoene dehydrogenase-like protein